MTRRVDLTGHRYGSWTVLGYAHTDDGRHAHWLCQCDCGTQMPVEGASLRRGVSTKCRECADRAKRLDLVGKTYGKWTVLAEVDRSPGRFRFRRFLCRCTCGTESTVFIHNLAHGHSTRCRSCANRQRRTGNG